MAAARLQILRAHVGSEGVDQVPTDAYGGVVAIAAAATRVGHVLDRPVVVGARAADRGEAAAASRPYVRAALVRVRAR